MSEYGAQDARATFDVSEMVLDQIKKEDSNIIDPNIPKQIQVVENESRLVHTLFNMEYLGVKVDREYCEAASRVFKIAIEKAEINFKKHTGLDFVKGTIVFEEVFESERDMWVMTDKKNWQWNKKVLSKFKNPAAVFAAEYSEAKKQLEYFQNFLWFADTNDRIHPTFDQAGTVTGRLSSRDPNFQNLTNPDKYEENSESSDFPVRRALVTTDGYFLAMLDWKQIEYRVFLDKASAHGLIDLILTGLDVHEATTKVAPVNRKEAKTVNFLTLYGGGAAKLAGMLFEPTVSADKLQAIYMMHVLNWNVTDEHRKLCADISAHDLQTDKELIEKAVGIQKAIFKASPQIKKTTKAIQTTAETRGYIFNWLGRRYQFKNKAFCYKAPNHYVQGSCADILKVAMNRTDEYLKDKQSRMVLNIHDELVLEVKFGEEFVIEEIKKIMETVYPFKRLPLEVDVEFSFDNLADKQSYTVENFTREQTARNQIQGKSNRGVKETSEHLVC
jgi:DNA polymerase-1